MAEIESLISQYGIPCDNPNNELLKSMDISSSEQGAVRAVGRILPTPILGGLHHHNVRI
jgi:hypothetical protein